MLHMIVNTHNPESCAFRSKEEEEFLGCCQFVALEDAMKSGENEGETR